MSGINTCIPAIVVGVHENECAVDVQPCINRLLLDGTVEEKSVLYYVPVVYPSTPRSALTFPIEKGDYVLLVFSQRGLDSFKADTGGPLYTPTDHRKFSERDAIAIPGVFPFSKNVAKTGSRSLPHNTKDLTLVHNIGKGTESELRITSTGDVKIKASATLSLEAEQATIEAQSLSVDVPNTTWIGNANITGTWIVNGVNVSDHPHSGVTPGAGTSGPPVPSP